jgi:hypothetical protein
MKMRTFLTFGTMGKRPIPAPIFQSLLNQIATLPAVVNLSHNMSEGIAV